MPPPPEQLTTLRPILIPAYGPTAFASIGTGAVLPVLALSARDLGAGVGTAAFVVALLGVGQLLADVPAGSLAARIGEHRALLLAAVLEAGALTLCWFAPTVWALGLAVLLLGSAAALFGLARQAYLTAAVPVRMRARALSTLGGVHRIGVFIGPFLGSAGIAVWGLGAAYAIGLAGALAALVVLLITGDITGDQERAAGLARRSTGSVLLEHWKVLLTLGMGALLFAAVRQARNALLPLWGEAIGLDPATTALVFGISGGVDMLFFYPAGWVMDRWGRLWVALPALLVMGVGLMVVPLTSTFWQLVAAGVVLGVGNGISSGIIMTLGSDAAPADARPQFLGGWRLMADTGIALGPAVISAVVAVSSLGVAAVLMGAVAWVGAVWMRVFVPRHDPISAAHTRRRRP